MLSASLVSDLSSLQLPQAVAEGPISARQDPHPPSGAESPLSLLDEQPEWSAFSRPLDKQRQDAGQTLWESHVVIEGMHCAACSLTIEAALSEVPGVLRASVSAGSHRACIAWSSLTCKPSVWMQAILRAGYRAVPANDAFTSERRRLETRQALWRWLVAGLCMMQVMMYAWPAYIAAPGDLTTEMEQLLRWASWVLTLPVMMFSCGPFFSAAWRDVRHRRISMDLPVALGILITFAVSTAGTFDPKGLFGQEVFFDSLTMFVFFLLTGRWLEFRLRDRTAGSLDAIMNRLPDGVERKTSGTDFVRVAVRRLVIGDVIRLSPGEVFPADGVILEGVTQADESMLTGESRPVSRISGDHVLAGSSNLGGVVLVQVLATGNHTRFSQIVSLMEDAATVKPTFALMVDRLAKPFLIAVLLAAGGACAYWWNDNPGHALMVAVAVLVVTCPCALSLATPAAMLSTAGTLARRGTLVRRLQAFETLSRVDWFIFDKTGTLTRDAMVISSITTRPGIDPSQALARAAALAQHSRHPASRAVMTKFSSEVKPESFQWSARQVEELSGQGMRGMVSTAAEPQISHELKFGSAAFCGVELSQMQGPAMQGSAVFLSDQDGWMATIALVEDIRPDAAQSLAALNALGMQVHILSGDTQIAANRLAADLGKGVGIGQVHGDCTPEYKLAFLRAAQKAGHQVAVVGDGLNDGPVLAAAHVSFAFGRAIPLAQAQADLVVLGERLLSVVDALVLARKTMRIVRQNLAWAVAYNAVCVPLAVFGYLPAWLAGLGMACSSLGVVLNALRLTSSKQLIRVG